jgi:ubiquinone/menaquinone biosynthesis C-methylase UbiE
MNAWTAAALACLVFLGVVAFWHFVLEHGNLGSWMLARVYDVNTWYCDISSMREFNTMNYGFAPLDESTMETLPFPHMLQLYRTVCLDTLKSVDLAPSDSVVVEVGVGRGGGLAYLHSLIKHGIWKGIDLCQPQIAMNKQYYTDVDPNLKFMVGDATNLDCLADNSVDALINIESSHNYPDMHAFHLAVRRVLKPGGKFMYSDFEKIAELDQLNKVLRDVWGNSEPKQNSEQNGKKKPEENQALIAVSSPEHDITAGVFEGLKASQKARKRLLDKYSPAWVRPWAPHILGLQSSIPYRRLESGIWIYFKIVLTKQK